MEVRGEHCGDAFVIWLHYGWPSSEPEETCLALLRSVAWGFGPCRVLAEGRWMPRGRYLGWVSLNLVQSKTHSRPNRRKQLAAETTPTVVSETYKYVWRRVFSPRCLLGRGETASRSEWPPKSNPIPSRRRRRWPSSAPLGLCAWSTRVSGMTDKTRSCLMLVSCSCCRREIRIIVVVSSLLIRTNYEIASTETSPYIVRTAGLRFPRAAA